LFAGLAVGLLRALTLSRRVGVPHAAMTGVHVVIGVMVGTLIQLDTLVAIAHNWLPVVLVTTTTLVLSLLAGQLMALRRGISRVTGAFSMVAGGATGITVMARELGADERMVAVLQYLRVLLIVLTLPTVAVLVFSADPAGRPGVGTAEGPGWWTDLGFTVGCGIVGTAVATLLRGDRDDPSRACGQHVRNDGVGGDVLRGEVERDLLVPRGPIGVREVAHGEAAHRAHEHVHPPVPLHEAVHEPPHRHVIAHVAALEMQACADLSADGSVEALPLLLGHPWHAHDVAVREKPMRDGLTQGAAAPRDDDDSIRHEDVIAHARHAARRGRHRTIAANAPAR
jgi:membrane AbrB-like protein